MTSLGQLVALTSLRGWSSGYDDRRHGGSACALMSAWSGHGFAKTLRLRAHGHVKGREAKHRPIRSTVLGGDLLGYCTGLRGPGG